MPRDDMIVRDRLGHDDGLLPHGLTDGGGQVFGRDAVGPWPFVLVEFARECRVEGSKPRAPFGDGRVVLRAAQ